MKKTHNRAEENGRLGCLKKQAKRILKFSIENFNPSVRTFRLGRQQNNKSIEIWSLKVFVQKLNYVHNSPVETGFVNDAVDWKYSSARNYYINNNTVLEINLN